MDVDDDEADKLSLLKCFLEYWCLSFGTWCVFDDGVNVILGKGRGCLNWMSVKMASIPCQNLNAYIRSDFDLF